MDTPTPSAPISQALTIPADVLERALGIALGERLATVDVEALELLDAKAAAKLLKLTPQGFRLIAKEHIDFGERRMRWSMKNLKALIEARKVKAGK